MFIKKFNFFLFFNLSRNENKVTKTTLETVINTISLKEKREGDKINKRYVKKDYLLKNVQ